MVRLSLLFTALKAFTCFWALITFAVAAALQGRFTSQYLGYYYSLPEVGATIAFGVLTWLYLLAFLACQFWLGNHVVTSVMADTIVLGFLFILGIGSVGSLSADATFFSSCSRTVACQLGSASVGLGWILVFLILGILLGEVIHTYRHYGGTTQTWLTSFNTLVDEDAPKRGAVQEMEAVSSANPTTAAPATTTV